MLRKSLNDHLRAHPLIAPLLREKQAAKKRPTLRMESLEHRYVMTATPVINEFMAVNQTSIVDENGDHSEWIELRNQGDTPADLSGMYLTNDASDLDKWQIPAGVSLAPDGYLVIFASGKDRAVAGQQLHTNFTLHDGGAGSYLALVAANGTNVVSSFANYTIQSANESYGRLRRSQVNTVIDDGTTSNILVPDASDNALIGASWTGAGFTPGAAGEVGWQNGALPVGFETLATPSGFLVELHRSSVAGSITSLATADALISGVNRINPVSTRTDAKINILNSGGEGHFGDSLGLPGGFTNDLEDFAIRATGTIFVRPDQAGLWTFGINADDGTRVRIDGTNVINDDVLAGPHDALGRRTLTPGTHTMEVTFFERGGGAEVEVFAAPGDWNAFDTAAFRLVGDVAAGGLATGGLDQVISTDLTATMSNVNASAYVRVPFTITNPADVMSMKLDVVYDDGYVAYLNGVEVDRRNAPASIAFNSAASVNGPLQTVSNLDLSAHANLLVPGQNVLSFQLLNASATDGEAFLAPELRVRMLLPEELRNFDEPTPGTPNGLLDPIISEFMASNDVTITDADGDASDWIELHNPGDLDIELDGYYLTNDSQDLDKWRIPNVVLEPGDQLLVFASGKDRHNPAGELHANFDLASSGGYLALVKPNGSTVVSAFNDYPEQKEDVSYGYEGSTFSTVLLDVNAPAQTLIPTAANPAVDNNWHNINFDTTGWTNGLSAVGFETGTGYESIIQTNVRTTMRPASGSGQTTAYIRVPFTVTDVGNLGTMTLQMKYDDGFAAFLNGVLVASANAPSPLVFNSDATTTHDDAQAVVFQDFDISQYINLLVPGQNVLAIHGLDDTLTSSDFVIQPRITASGATALTDDIRFFNTPTPDRPNGTGVLGFLGDTNLVTPHGFYTAPVTVIANNNSPGLTGIQIWYTTNGNTPTNVASPTNFLYTGPFQVSSTTVVRARAFKDGLQPSNVATQSYLFLEDIIRQAETPPAGWPAALGGNTTSNYGMDPDVVNPNIATIKDDLMAIPTWSIVTDINNLFGTTGIYSNPGGEGAAWERAASFEVIDPLGGEDGFTADGGLRIRGGFSRSTDNPKHAWRLFFRKEYGSGKLDYPLFGDEGADSYDKIDLKTSQNYSWAFQNDGANNTFVREPFFRVLQRDMDQPYTRGKFYHVYVNGYYFGLYETQERSEASYGESYFGGDRDEYDTVKAEAGPYETQATDGDTIAWTRFVCAAQDLAPVGMVDPTVRNAANNPVHPCGALPAPMSQPQKYEAYMKLQGLNIDGTRNPAYEVQLDVDNLIVYMLGIIYGGNADAPISNFIGNNRVNNWFGVRRRVGEINPDGDKGWAFFAHDNEHTLGVPLGTGADRSGPWTAADLDRIQYSNPQTVFEYLWGVDEFRVHVGDMIQKAFFNGGAMTQQVNIARLQELAAQIDRAIVGESARWGDAKQAVGAAPYTRTNWLNAVNSVITGFFPVRQPIVIDQFKADGIFPTVVAPSYSQFGGHIDAGYQLLMSAPSGSVYYTTDGSDPRLVGGGISPSAIPYNAESHYVTSGTSAKLLIPTGVAGENGWQNTAFNDASWTTSTTAIGYDTGATESGAGFTLRVVDTNSGPSIPDINTATDLLDDGQAAGYGIASDGTYFVPYVDMGDAGNMNNPITLAFPGTGDREQFAVRATTTVTIPAGNWSIAVGSDDGFKLTMPAGVTFSGRGNADGGTANNVLQWSAPRGHTQTIGQFTLAAPITGTLVLDFYEAGGGDSVEMSILNSATTVHNATTFQTLQNGTFGWTVQTTTPTSDFTPAISTNVQAVMLNVNSGAYLRMPFTATNAGNVASLILRTKYDDGFVAYLNGTEVARRNVAAGTPAFNAVASDARNDGQALIFEEIDISAFKNLLINGNNVLAVHALNRSASNPDFLFNATLDATFAGIPVTLTESTNVQARALSGGTWSALTDATFTVNPPALRVSEIMYNPADPTAAESLAGFTDNDDFEFIEVRNVGGTPLDLDGIHFTNGITFTFSSATLDPGDYAVVVKNQAAFVQRYGIGHNVVGVFGGNLNNAGERIALTSGLDEAIQDFSYHDSFGLTDGGGYSLTKIDTSAALLTWDDITAWRPSDYTHGSPGASDAGLAPPQSSIKFNELLTNTGGALGTRIELLNTAATSVDVSGFYLTDDDFNLTKYRLPTLPPIAPGGYLVLDASTTFGSAFQLAPQGGRVVLRGADGAGNLIGFNVDETYEASDAEVSQGRIQNSVGEKDFVSLTTQTFGSANAGPKVGPIIVNELMYNSLFGNDDFVELYNNSAAPVALAGWSFGSGISYAFGAVSMNPGEYLVVSPIDPATFRAKYSIPASVQIVGPYAGVLDNGGEDLRLVKPGPLGSSVLVDRVEYDDELPWPIRPDGTGASLGRIAPTSYGNDPNNWSSGALGGTPGSTNTVFDETPPSIPTNLAATAQTGPQVTLTWTPSVDLQSPVSGYKVYRNGVVIASPPSASYVDTTVNASTTYSYRVSAVNASGIESAPSSALSVRVLTVASADAVSATSVRVRFTDTVTASAANVANYIIGGVSISAAVVEAGNTSVLLTTSALVNGQPYRITANNIVSSSGVPIIANSQAFFTPGASAGLFAEYFDDPDNTDVAQKLNPANRVLTRVDPKIDFSYTSAQSPDPIVPRDYYSARWTGTIQPLFSEVYTFSTTSNDGMRVYINNQLVIDKWLANSQVGNGQIALLAGQRYPLRVEYFENTLTSVGRLSWASASQASQIVPTERLAVPITIESTPPTVSKITVGSSQWTPAFASHLATVNPAWTGGVEAPLGGSTTVLPWSNLDQVRVKFDSDVNVSSSQLSVNGVNVANYGVASFAYDFATFTATWTLSQPIDVDVASITVSSAVRDLADNSVTGPRTSSVRVAAGDVNGDGSVLVGDRTANVARQFTSIGHPSYLAAHDINGDGVVNVRDLVALNFHVGSALPPPSPAASAEAIVRSATARIDASAEISTAAEPLRVTRRAAANAERRGAVDRAIEGATPSAASDSSTRTLRARRTARSTAAIDSVFAAENGI